MAEFKDVKAAVKRYVALRDKLREWQKKREEEEALRKKTLEEIEMWLLLKADELGVDSFKTEFGTAYKSFNERYRINDWEKFVAYVKETNNFQLFEKRVAKLAAKEVHQEAGEVPSGLDYSREAVMHVLRPGKNK